MNVQEYIDANDMTRKQFAKKIGVHYNTVTNWLRGHTMPHPDHIKKVEVVTKRKVKFKDMMQYAEEKKKNG